MRVMLALSAVVFLAACDSGTEERTEVSSTRVVQRPFVGLPPGVVPRGAAAQTAALAPPGPAVTQDLLHRGGERHRIFCMPCHGVAGSGDGPVASRGFPPLPSYRDERLQAIEPADIVTIITNGKGLMYSYAGTIPPEDRWAIAHYVKSLQGEAVGP